MSMYKVMKRHVLKAAIHNEATLVRAAYSDPRGGGWITKQNV